MILQYLLLNGSSQPMQKNVCTYSSSCHDSDVLMFGSNPAISIPGNFSILHILYPH